MTGQRVLVKREQATSLTEAWKTGWNKNKGGGEPQPEWIECTLLSFVNSQHGTKAIVKRQDGKVMEVPVSAIRYP